MKFILLTWVGMNLYYVDTYSNIDISIKPSQLGLLIDSPHSKDLCSASLGELAEHARETNNTIRLDMEDSRTTIDTVDLAVTHNIGCAMQVNHPDTYALMIQLLDDDVPIRLVKGAYREPDNITDEDRIHDLFLLYAQIRKNITIATHDESLLNKLQDYDQFEFLYGVRRDLQKKLKDEGKQVRIYVPYGENWLPYTIRRLKEWKNLKFIISNIWKEIF